MATNGKTKAVNEIEEANGYRYEFTDEGRAAFEKFSQLYPPAVVETLYDNLLRHIQDCLEKAGLKDDADLIGDELFFFSWYLKAHAGGTVNLAEAAELIDFCGFEGLHENVAKAIRIQAADDLLSTIG